MWTWEECLLLAVFWLIAIFLLVINIRWTIRFWRKNTLDKGINRASENEIQNTDRNYTNCHDEGNKVIIDKINKYHQEYKNQYTYDNNQNPFPKIAITLAHLTRIISKVKIWKLLK